MRRTVNETEHQINLLWWGSEELPIKQALDEYRGVSSLRDSFIFASTEAEAITALSASGSTINVLFINKVPAQATPFLSSQRSLVTNRMVVVMPAPYTQFMDRATVGSFNIKSYLYLEPQQALRDLPGFLERQLLAAQKVSKR